MSKLKIKHRPKPNKRQQDNSERLTAASIIRNGEVFDRGFKSHWQLRAALDPEMDNPAQSVAGDIEGFATSGGRFVTRREAVPIAIASGQISDSWLDAHRDLLSSDINW